MAIFTLSSCSRFIHASFNTLLLLTPTARADEFSAIVTGSSNYFYRGYSKSAGAPTVRANLEYQPSSWFYAGSWISRVDFDDDGFNDRSGVELYPYVGVNFNLAESWRLETAVARYIYDGHLFGKNSDYNEYSASLHFRDLITCRIDFADDAYQRGRTTVNYEISGRYPLAAKLSVSAGTGYFNAEPTLEYDLLYWNLGLTWFFKYGALDFRYVDSSESSPSYQNKAFKLPELDNRFVFSLSSGF